MNVCVIPARGGSKRIPRKNIRLFCEKPMLAWSIEAAHSSGCFDRVVVSTDDEEIASVARAHDAEVPFIRPAHLADDHAGTREVIVHAVQHLQHVGFDPQAVCCLYATAPLVDPKSIKDGFEMLSKADTHQFVFSVATYSYPIQRALKRDSPSGLTKMFWPKEFLTRSQDLEPSFHDAGQFYWGRPAAWLKNGNLFEGGMPLVLPRCRVQDIDTEEDWQLAEFLMEILKARLS